MLEGLVIFDCRSGLSWLLEKNKPSPTFLLNALTSLTVLPIAHALGVGQKPKPLTIKISCMFKMCG